MGSLKKEAEKILDKIEYPLSSIDDSYKERFYKELYKMLNSEITSKLREEVAKQFKIKYL